MTEQMRESVVTHEAGATRPTSHSITGCLLGTAVADALGLASEGLSPRRRAKLFPDPTRYHLLPFGYGMCSDDTEHTVMLAQSLCTAAEQGDDEMHARAIAASFAWRLRFWLLGLPAGIGLATLRAIVKLWLFVPPRWSGVFSAGNAPAMRSALLGLVYAGQPERMRTVVRAITRVTHTDPKAEHAAWTVAFAAQCSAAGNGRVDAASFVTRCNEVLGADAAEWSALLARVVSSVHGGESTPEFARTLGLHKGVTGYCFHSVPVALHAFLAHPANYRAAVLAAIECGGDTDTVAAITGAMAGAGVGKQGIPAEWLERLVEWPRTVGWMERLGGHLAQRVISLEESRAGRAPIAAPGRMPTANPIALILRNLLFMPLVLLHGFRRLLPPY
jgi:ADP-ribosyl-[dinitrogen reductase] hydrolase